MIKKVFSGFLILVAIILGLAFNITIANQAQANMTSGTFEYSQTGNYTQVTRGFFTLFPYIGTIIVVLGIVGAILLFNTIKKKL